MSHDRILILDFGSQVTQLIARRVREAHVYCEVHANDVSAEFIREFNPKGIILSGSHMSAYEESNDQVSPAVFEAGVPVLGICYGMQTMAQQLGGRVEGSNKREFGYAEVRAHNHTKLLGRHRGLPHGGRPRDAEGLDVARRQGDGAPRAFPSCARRRPAPSPACATNPAATTPCSSTGSDPHRQGPRNHRALRALDLRRGPTG